MKKYLHKNNKKNIPAPIGYIAVLLFWIAIWKIASLCINKEILFPSPELCFYHLILLFKNEIFLRSLLYSILRVIIGYIVGLTAGTLFALLSLASGVAKALLAPARAIIKSTPVASFIILAYLWMSKNEIPGFTASLIVIPIVWGNIVVGFSDIGAKQLDVAKVFGFGIRKKIKYIYIPEIKSYFTASALTSFGLAWKAGISAEALVRTKYSIGGLLYDAKVNFESADLFALTALIIIISLIFEAIIGRISAPKGKSKKSDKI